MLQHVNPHRIDKLRNLYEKKLPEKLAVPPEILPHHIEFCRQNGLEDPQYVQADPFLKLKETAFDDITDYASTEGGTVVPGWRLWEWPGVELVCDFFPCWRDPDEGELLDILERKRQKPRILFAIDPVRKWTGVKPSYFRKALSDNGLIKAFVQAENEVEKLYREREALPPPYEPTFEQKERLAGKLVASATLLEKVLEREKQRVKKRK